MPSHDVYSQDRAVSSGSTGAAHPGLGSVQTVSKVAFTGKVKRAWFKFSTSWVGSFVAIYLLVAVPALVAGTVAWNVTSPPVDLGRATAVSAAVNGAEMVRFPDGSFAPARLENVREGDSVTVFLNGSTVTNDPSTRSSVSMLWALLGAGLGLVLALLFMAGQVFRVVDRKLR